MDRARALRVLDLGHDATREQIKEAYRDLVKVWHPDHYPAGSRLHQRAHRKLAEINEAYAVLRAGGGDPAPEPPARSRGRGRRGRREGARFRVDQWVFAGAVLVMGVMGLLVINRLDDVLEPVQKMTRDLSERSNLMAEIQKPFRAAPPKPADAAQALPADDGHTGPGLIEIEARTVSPTSPDSGDAPRDAPRDRPLRVGMTKMEVHATRGEPNKALDDEWHYGASRVRFRDERVIEWWSSPSDPLPGEPYSPEPSKGTLRVGMSEAEVIALEGMWSKRRGNTLHYGTSRIVLRDGLVESWDSSPERPLREPGASPVSSP